MDTLHRVSHWFHRRVHWQLLGDVWQRVLFARLPRFPHPFFPEGLNVGSIAFGLIAALSWGIHDILVRYVGQTVGILRSLFLVLVFGAIIQAVVALAFADFSRLSSDGGFYSV